jgi:cytochrome P450
MTLYPEVQAKAQAEIDTVIGTGRLPSARDRDQLPFVDALVKEVYRWGSVGPAGLAHRSMQDDFFEGYWIPKGSFVIPNIWCAFILK